jgi:hypothetical protein
MKLTGIELRNFRSIGDEPVKLAPWLKCNILIGQNNSGKSNVIKAVQRISSTFMDMMAHKDLPRTPREGLGDLDLHRRSPENQFLFRLYFEGEAPEDKELLALIRTASVYFDFSWEVGQPDPRVTDHSFAYIEDFDQASRLLSYLEGAHFTSRMGPSRIRQVFLKKGPTFWGHFKETIPPVYIIPEFRQIKSGSEYTLDGANLIGLLASYQHPEVGKGQDRDKFDRIERFVQRLLHLPEAVLEVPRKETTIMLTSNGLRLPLASYGTGVHELVILVTAVLSVEDAICCIEEPEIHLHPRLQREFIDFITTETTNQYLISTHSPTFINAMSARDDVQVFHLRLENGATIGGPILRDEDSLRALHDLGVRASDILQSNCVLWVEGPSDRVYLERWLELVSPELVEGRDYSIMFYGGSLLSHLCAERDKVPGELIHILRINQNAIVMMDSDIKHADDPLTQTKQRVCQECKANGGICWVTDGREIENYLPERVVAAACEELVGKQIAIAIGPYDKFEDTLSQALKTARARSLDYSADKVKYTRKFAQHFKLADMGSQLREHIEEIAAKVKYWNE